MSHYRVSCRSFTVRVGVDGKLIIREAAPLVKRFLGQPLGNLKRWAAGFGGLEVDGLY